MKRVFVILFTIVISCCAFLSLSNIGNTSTDDTVEASVETLSPVVQAEVMITSVPVAVTPEPTPIPTPVPTPTPVLSIQIGSATVYETDISVDLSTVSSAELATVISFVKSMPNLQSVNIGTNYSVLGADNVVDLVASTGAELTGSISLYGQTVSLDTTSLDFNGVSIDDGGAELRNAVSVLPLLQTVYVQDCGLGNETLGQFQQDFPDVDFVWRIYFGDKYSCLTTNETILASKPSVYNHLTNENTVNLRYCTRVKNLDLGHNSKLTDCSFISYMPDLEICILTCTSVNSLEPFRNCKKLVLLEIGDANVTDLSPLAECTSLKYLNIGLNTGLSTYSPLYGLQNLRKLSIGGTGDALNTVSELEAALSGIECEIIKDLVYIDSNGSYTATEGMWRYDRMVASEENWIHAQETGVGTFVNSENYTLVREAFNYDLGSGAYCTEANGF